MKRVTDNYEYDPDDVLGSGTASTVYRGRALDTGETVAVKVVRAEMEKDLEKEVGFLMALTHPNIVHVFTYHSVCSSPFLPSCVLTPSPFPSLYPVAAVHCPRVL